MQTKGCRWHRFWLQPTFLQFVVEGLCQCGARVCTAELSSLLSCCCCSCGTHDGLRWIRLLLRYANIIQLSPLLNPVLGIYNILASSCSSQQQESIINPLDGASDRLLTWPCTSCQDWPSKLHLQQEVHFSDVGA